MATKEQELSMNEIERLAEAWSLDKATAKRIRIFLQEFGPSDSDLIFDFFKWVKTEHGGLVTYHMPGDPREIEQYANYTINFVNDMDKVAYILRFK